MKKIQCKGVDIWGKFNEKGLEFWKKPQFGLCPPSPLLKKTMPSLLTDAFSTMSRKQKCGAIVLRLLVTATKVRKDNNTGRSLNTFSQLANAQCWGWGGGGYAVIWWAFSGWKVSKFLAYCTRLFRFLLKILWDLFILSCALNMRRI